MPYIAHESAMVRMERANRRAWIIVIFLAIALIVSNVAWMYYESQYEDVYTEVTQENEDGINNYIGNDGDIYNGETGYQNTKANP